VMRERGGERAHRHSRSIRSGQKRESSEKAKRVREEGGRHDEETGTNIEVDDGLGHCRGRIDDGSEKEKGD
jgi:hypothetical protein